MVSCNFVFDIILTKLEAFNCNIDDIKKLQVEFKFNGISIPIPPDCINASDFQPAHATEFMAFPMNLRQSLEECGMLVSIQYDNKQIGTGQMLFPQDIVSSIEEGMEDMIHSDTCYFEKDGDVQGRIEILCRLIIKCDNAPKSGDVDCNLSKCIKPEDIMFIMADSQRSPKPCDPCLDMLDKVEGYNQIGLDLHRYDSSNIDALLSDKVFKYNPAGDAISCELQDMATECTQFVDTLLKNFGQPQHLKSRSGGGSPYGDSANYPSKDSLDEATKALPSPTCLNQHSLNNIIQPHVRPTRFCSVCLSNMSWLPKFATCPNCGVKPMPDIRIRHKKKKPVTDNLLYEFLHKTNTNNDQVDVDASKIETNKRPECRCTCKHGKPCSYCRVIKKVAPFYKPPPTKPKPIPLMASSESIDNCVPQMKRSEPHRPFLSRVFSELRDMYDIKNCVKPGQTEKQGNRGSLSRKRKNDVKNNPVEQRKQSISAPHKQAAQKKKFGRVPHKPAKQKLKGRKKYYGKQRGAVSRQHGWAWCLSKEARKYGWQPGSVPRAIRRIMRFFLGNSEVASCNALLLDAHKQGDDKNPILNMCKKNGEILITLRAVDNPRIKMKPIVFKIVKSDLARIISEVKRRLKCQGFRKCTCNQSIMMCVCRNKLEKIDLETALRTECHRYGIESCVNDLVLTDTSDSEMEYDIDVTPPAGMPQSTLRLKSQSVNISTQTVKKEKVESTYPVKNSPYVRTYDCAAGDRYTSTAFGNLRELVFEDGLFNFRGGGAHGDSAKFRGRQKSNVIWGAKPGGPMRGGGRMTTGAIFNSKGFPGEKKQPRKPSAPIPVRMPKRLSKPKEAPPKDANSAKRPSKNYKSRKL